MLGTPTDRTWPGISRNPEFISGNIFCSDICLSCEGFYLFHLFRQIELKARICVKKNGKNEKQIEKYITTVFKTKTFNGAVTIIIANELITAFHFGLIGNYPNYRGEKLHNHVPRYV